MVTMIIWRTICTTCKKVIFEGNVPKETYITVRCPNCGDLFSIGDIPHGMPMLVKKWERIIDYEQT